MNTDAKANLRREGKGMDSRACRWAQKLRSENNGLSTDQELELAAKVFQARRKAREYRALASR